MNDSRFSVSDFRKEYYLPYEVLFLGLRVGGCNTLDEVEIMKEKALVEYESYVNGDSMPDWCIPL